jgi:uncharacterized membrane protein YwzB
MKLSPPLMFAIFIAIVCLACAINMFFKKNYIEGSLCMIAIPILVGATLGWGR